MGENTWVVTEDIGDLKKGQVLEATEGRNPVGDGYFIKRETNPYCVIAGGCTICSDQNCFYGRVMGQNGGKA